MTAFSCVDVSSILVAVGQECLWISQSAYFLAFSHPTAVPGAALSLPSRNLGRVRNSSLSSRVQIGGCSSSSVASDLGAVSKQDSTSR
jgi:hypothetical protein